jgi:uncharacterized repeat protein (TIGR01451 family)
LCLERLEDRCTPTVLTVTTRADDTLYEDSTGQLSNGAGQHFYVGDTNQPSGSIRRGIIAFNLSGVPAGSVIQSATLTLHMSFTKGGAQSIALHRALQSWGQGTSNAAGGSPGTGEGDGTQATPGDVTWVYTFFNTQRWTNPGGNFVAAASTATSVADVGTYQWTGAGLTADVQQWVNSPATNFGWILIGEEVSKGNAKQFDTRENTTPADRPELTINYTPGTITPAPDLTIHMSQSGTFHTSGSATYTITVTNSGTASTTGLITVRDVLPVGLTYTGLTSINGWTVSVDQQTITATRSDTLAAHGRYPALVIPVSIASKAQAKVANTATVSGGDEVNTGNDVATAIAFIQGPKQLQRRRGA